MWTTAEWLAFWEGEPDEDVRRPLWEFPPASRPAIQHERRVRFNIDDEPIGDPEYS